LSNIIKTHGPKSFKRIVKNHQNHRQQSSKTMLKNHQTPSSKIIKTHGQTKRMVPDLENIQSLLKGYGGICASTRAHMHAFLADTLQVRAEHHSAHIGRRS
jgi:hypothetical protein